MKEKVNFGYEPNHGDTTFDRDIFQGPQPTCAIRSQEIIMRDYGISIPQEELIEFATQNGWYDPDPEHGGTPGAAIGNILDAMGIQTRRYDNASIFDIISELRAGHRVIVSVDADELWIKNEPKLYKRIFGELTNRVNDKLDAIANVGGANHALIVAGVQVDPANPSDMHVILIDSGSGDVCIEYAFKDFKKAWDDSHCHMITTMEPAPYQYNYRTHQMEPSNFGTDFIPSMVSLPAGLQNEFHLPENYYADYADYSPCYVGADCSESIGEFYSEIFGDDYSAEMFRTTAYPTDNINEDGYEANSDTAFDSSYEETDNREEEPELSADTESTEDVDSSFGTLQDDVFTDCDDLTGPEY